MHLQKIFQHLGHPNLEGHPVLGVHFGRKALPCLEETSLFKRLPGHLAEGLILREYPPYNGQLPVSQQLQMSPVPSTGAQLKQNYL